MNVSNSPTDRVLQSSAKHVLPEQERRRRSLIAIVNEELPPLPTALLDLATILSSPSADLKKAGAVIRSDPSLSAQVLRLCNSPLFGLRSRVVSIEQAAVLIGMERLRNLALSCSVAAFAGSRLPQEPLRDFWQHSHLAALLTEQVARQLEYSEKEQAYIAGLLHDIGQLPLRMLAVEEEAQQQAAPPAGWPDNRAAEYSHFGTDHCEIGKSMAASWNFMPSFLDVLEFHHEPMRATHDPNLVNIVACVEHFLLMKTQEKSAASNEVVEASIESAASTTVFPYPPGVLELLHAQYDHLLPLVQLI